MTPFFCSTPCCTNFAEQYSKATRNAARPNRARPADIHGSSRPHSLPPPRPQATAPATAAATPVYVFGIPVDFILFGLTLIGVAIFHHKTLQVALTGLAAIVLYKLVFTGFKSGAGLAGLALHMQHEAVILANLFLLLMGFAILSRHFENSRVPDEMPAFLPDGWTRRRSRCSPSCSCCRASSTTSRPR